MKKFIIGGEYFALTTYKIKKIAFETDSDSKGIELAKSICEDACCLSSNGSGQTAVEILRIAGNHTGSEISHYLTIRTHDKLENACAIRQETLICGICSMFHQAGFVVEEVPYDNYRRLIQTRSEAAWALRKQDIIEYGIQNTYVSTPVIEEVDWKSIYSALDGSGCTLTIQMIPSLLTPEERKTIVRKVADYSQAIDGIIPNMRDSLAKQSADRWKYYTDKQMQSFAHVNIVVRGPRSSCALVVARIKQSVSISYMETVPVADFDKISIFNQPWKISNLMQNGNNSVICKWTSDETAEIFRLPYKSDYFVGIEGNAFSLIPETDLLPGKVTKCQGLGLLMGKSVYSDQCIYIPREQFLLHTAVIGKSGSGKTTLMKHLITQFSERKIPILIMEPVKREYRDLAIGLPDSKIFTVERPVVPFLLNPFRVPHGVVLGEYRSSLLSAFKAAFSLPDPLPSLFEKAISEAYIRFGWTDASKSTDDNVIVFDMADFVRVFKDLIEQSSYSAEVKGNMMSGGAFRLQSLIERCPRTFDTINSTNIEDLLNGCVVMEMGNLEPEQKTLVSALTLISILAYLKCTRRSENVLKNIIMIDEAHTLLDQGEGMIQEEKALNSTMMQLMVNIITEIRAYGVGVIFSDQSPSRVGNCIMDNVDNIIAFRLSGEEAELLRMHIGGDENINSVLPLLSAGEFVLKNRFIKSPLPVHDVSDFPRRREVHITDAEVARRQANYLLSRIQSYRPFALCESAGCSRCTFGIRDTAYKLAVQIFTERRLKLKEPDQIASHILMLPEVLSSHERLDNTDAFAKLCNCVAVHLIRLCSKENGVHISNKASEILLTEMHEKFKKGRTA